MLTALIDRVIPLAAASTETPAGSGHPGLLSALLEEIDLGLLVVNERGDVRYANRAALRDCGPGRPLHCDGRQLRADPDELDRLHAALSGARGGRRAMLCLGPAHAPLTVGVVPIERDRDFGDAVALLVLGRRDHSEPLSLQFFAQMHRLTPAESAVLARLCDGMTPTEVARHCGVALSTVRTQIDCIRQKTRARSANQVVRMVQQLPPLMPALAGGGGPALSRLRLQPASVAPAAAAQRPES